MATNPKSAFEPLGSSIERETGGGTYVGRSSSGNTGYVIAGIAALLALLALFYWGSGTSTYAPPTATSTEQQAPATPPPAVEQQAPAATEQAPAQTAPAQEQPAQQAPAQNNTNSQ
ncbi:MAG: hypothetical protein ACKVP5_18960 [Aestuariivirga sp.]